MYDRPNRLETSHHKTEEETQPQIGKYSIIWICLLLSENLSGNRDDKILMDFVLI